MSDISVRIAQTSGSGMISIRADLADEGFREAATPVLGVGVPQVRKAEFAGERTLVWMSPDELLLLLPHNQVAEMLAALDAALEGRHRLVADVSDARAVFTLEGSRAREVLARGAPVDLSAEAFGTGDVRRTRLGQVAVAFWMPAPDQFDLICFRSVSEYVGTWLENAARPGGAPAFL